MYLGKTQPIEYLDHKIFLSGRSVNEINRKMNQGKKTTLHYKAIKMGTVNQHINLINLSFKLNILA